MKILQTPLHQVNVTQPFGVNWVRPGYYKAAGYPDDKHPGVDFSAKVGCKFYSAMSGKVVFAGKGNSGSINLIINDGKWQILYAHCSKLFVKRGDDVEMGQLCGLTGNTGKFTTAPHLHFELMRYWMKIDPAEYFGKNWDKPRAYHRYGRKQEWKAEWKMRFKNFWLHRQLKKRGQINKIYDISFINAIVYGGWDFRTVVDPAMYSVWSQLKKSEFLKGAKPFLDK